MNHRELPIIFTSESVRAILAGRKSQTRRIVNPEVPKDGRLESVDNGRSQDFRFYGDNGIGWRRSRYRVGDVLWVKEAWNIGRALRDAEGTIDDMMIWPGSAPKEDPRGKRLFDDWTICYRADGGEPPWRSTLYMPRWASRISLEVTEVRAQRVQDISEDDAKAEGVDPYICGEGPVSRDAFYCEGGFHNYDRGKAFRRGFEFEWDRINGKRSPWSRNDFVFAYTFRRQS